MCTILPRKLRTTGTNNEPSRALRKKCCCNQKSEKKKERKKTKYIFLSFTLIGWCDVIASFTVIIKRRDERSRCKKQSSQHVTVAINFILPRFPQPSSSFASSSYFSPPQNTSKYHIIHLSAHLSPHLLPHKLSPFSSDLPR